MTVSLSVAISVRQGFRFARSGIRSHAKRDGMHMASQRRRSQQKKSVRSARSLGSCGRAGEDVTTQLCLKSTAHPREVIQRSKL